MQHIVINVATKYLPEQSEPNDNRFAFAYTITISNTGGSPAKLLRRHWIITDGNQQIREVIGEGVVGETPLIEPGGAYTYTSGAVLETLVGTMEGTYEFEEQDGNLFTAEIPRFVLAQPNAIH